MPTPPEIRNPYPRLNARAQGWLRHLHRKAMTPDDWSEEGKPHPWWDQYSSPPMTSFPRFDLQESTYALGIMADQTPAWRETYGDILNGLAERSITFWAAVDWLTQFGPDPRRKEYPIEYQMLIPEDRIGEYDTPGWVANGIEPWGLQPDPIAADGNLFFKGWLNLTQSMHHYMTGSNKWASPFQVAGVEKARFEWTQEKAVAHLVKQWDANPLGVHCENTKIWTFCLSAAGLGLQLYDALNNKTTHQTHQNWQEHTKDKYYHFDKKGALEWLAMYYDPLIEYTHQTAPPFALAVGFYILPQNPAFAEQLYRGAIRAMQWDDPSQPILPMFPEARIYALGLALAKELGDVVVETKLRDYAERHFEPRQFGEEENEFGFWFNLGEDWPRGQLSALAMVSEIGGVGAWQKLFRQPNLAKFTEPVVEDIDYPALSVSQAFHDNQAGMLQLSVWCGIDARRNEATKFTLANLPNSKDVHILCDGEEYKEWKVIDDHRAQVSTTLAPHSFQIFTGYRADAKQKEQANARKKQTNAAKNKQQQTANPRTLSTAIANIAKTFQPTAGDCFPPRQAACCGGAAF